MDGDEIWQKQAIQNIVEIINKNPDLDFIVQPMYTLVGDIYHYQPESAGRYNICGYKGHVTFRAMNIQKIGGIKFQGAHMQQGIFTLHNRLIQDIPNAKFVYQPIKYFHTTHLQRSSQDYQVQKRAKKYKFELGIPFSKNFDYPEVFYQPHPNTVPDIWAKRSIGYTLRACLETPLKTIKRRYG